MAASLWQYYWWAFVAQHPEDRVCYRTIQKKQVCSILEMGLEDGVRSQRMIQVALRSAGVRPVHYVGIDLFEGHEEPEDRLCLKDAHKQFSALGARVKLLPGDAFSALSRAANQLNGIDLVVIGQDQDPEAVERCWFYLPRCLSDNAVVLLQGGEEDDYKFQVINRDQLKELAGSGRANAKKAA